MKKVSYWGGIIGFILLIVVGYRALLSYQEPQSEQFPFTVMAEDSGITGWSNGKKQWYIKADSVKSYNGVIVLTGLSNGILFRDGAPDAHFSAQHIEYNEGTKQLQFSDGLTMEMDGKAYTIGSGIWDGVKRLFHGVTVELKQADSWCMTAEAMDYDEGVNSYTWSQHINIVGHDHSGGNFLVKADKLVFSPEKKQWTVTGDSLINWQRGQSQETFAIKTTAIVFDDEASHISFPDTFSFTGNDCTGTGNNALATGAEMNINSIHLTSGDATIQATTAKLTNEEWKFSNNVIYNQKDGTQFSANQVVIVGKNVTAEGPIALQRGGSQLTCDSMTVSQGEKVYDLKGNIHYEPQAGVTLIADTMSLNEQTQQAKLSNIHITHNGGDFIVGDNADYDEGAKILVLEQNVCATDKQGRVTRADKAVYDIEKKTIKFQGKIKSSKADDS